MIYRRPTHLGLAALLLSSSGWAADTDGLDLTIEVLGKNEQIDERIVNRIEIPGVRLDAAEVGPGPSAAAESLSPVLQPPLGLVKDLARDALELLRPREEAAAK